MCVPDVYRSMFGQLLQHALYGAVANIVAINQQRNSLSFLHITPESRADSPSSMYIGYRHDTCWHGGDTTLPITPVLFLQLRNTEKFEPIFATEDSYSSAPST